MPVYRIIMDDLGGAFFEVVAEDEAEALTAARNAWIGAVDPDFDTMFDMHEPRVIELS